MLDPFTILLEGKTCTVLDAKGAPQYTKVAKGLGRAAGFCRFGKLDPEFYIGSAGRWYNPDTIAYTADPEQPFATYRRGSSGSTNILNAYGEPVVILDFNKDQRPSMTTECAKILGATGFWARMFAPSNLKIKDPAAHRELAFVCGRSYDVSESGRLAGRIQFATDLSAARFLPLQETKYIDRRGLIGWTERRLQGMLQEKKQSAG